MGYYDQRSPQSSRGGDRRRAPDMYAPYPPQAPMTMMPPAAPLLPEDLVDKVCKCRILVDGCEHAKACDCIFTASGGLVCHFMCN